MKRSKMFPGTKIKRTGLFFIEYWKRDNKGGWTLEETRSGGSEGWARWRASTWLGSVVTTNGNYHRDLGRADYCVVRKDDGTKFTIEPEMEIVPSVSELGYW